MQFNCLLFQAKKDVNIDSIANNVVLIPHEQDQTHIYYLNLINPANRVKDELASKINTTKVVQHPISVKEEIKKLYQNKKITPQLSQHKYAIQQSFYYLQTQRKTSSLSQNTPLELKSFPVSNMQQNRKLTQQPTKPSIKVKGYIPCLFLPGSQKIIMYFHGNAEDIKSSSQFLKFIYNATGYSIFAMQYQGYSIYEGSPSAQKIQNDIRIVMNYLIRMGLTMDRIFVIGRSIGSGPALSLVSQYKPAGIMLISPFLSVCKIVQDKYGKFASILVKQRFQNYKIIQFIQVPVLILHGTNDNIIPYSHSEKLHQLSNTLTELRLVEGMTHMAFDFRNHFLVPLEAFFSKIKF